MPDNQPKLTRKKNQKWENLLEFHLRTHGLSGYFKREVIIPESHMKRPFDFADMTNRVLIEVQGGIWSKGKSGHAWGSGIMRDHVKINDAQFHGYIVFQFSDNPIKDLSAIDFIVMYYRQKLKLPV